MNNISETIPASKAKVHFSSLLRRIREQHESFAITQRGRIEGVLLSYEEYEGLLETLEILSDRQLMKSLERGLRDEKAERVVPHAEIFEE